MYTADNMLTKPSESEFSAVRMHLIGYFCNKDITKITNTEMRIEHFQRVLTQINKIAFGFMPKS